MIKRASRSLSIFSIPSINTCVLGGEVDFESRLGSLDFALGAGGCAFEANFAFETGGILLRRCGAGGNVAFDVGMGHLEYHIALTGIGTLTHRAHRDQHTNSEKMSDSVGHLEQCMYSKR